MQPVKTFDGMELCVSRLRYQAEFSIMVLRAKPLVGAGQTVVFATCHSTDKPHSPLLAAQFYGRVEGCHSKFVKATINPAGYVLYFFLSIT